jgi:hypothetical protein
MDGARAHRVSEVSQAEKDQCCMFSVICGIWTLKLKNDTHVKQVLCGVLCERRGEGCRWGV